MTSAPLRAGLVGYGFAGQTFHAPVLSAVPGLELAAVASSQPDKVNADWPGVAVVPDVDTLVARSDIDLVVVATPDAQHYPVARAALEAGKHVVVDKPFTLDVAEARALEALSKRNNRVLAVYQNRRFDADFLTLQELLAGGELGRPVYMASHFDRFRPEVKVRWREQAVPGSGLWVDLGAHLVDQSVQLFGWPGTRSSSTRRCCATARWLRTTSMPCCATKADRMPRCAWCCIRPRWQPRPRRATSCTARAAATSSTASIRRKTRCVPGKGRQPKGGAPIRSMVN